MVYQVELAGQARDDLRQSTDHLAFTVNDTACAESSCERVKAKIRPLAQFPEMGRRVPEPEMDGCREVILSPYRILYELDHEARLVTVLRFWHGSRGTPRLTDDE